MKVNLPKRRAKALARARDLVEKYNLDSSPAANKVRLSRRELETAVKPDMRSMIEEIVFAWGVIERLARDRESAGNELKATTLDPVSVHQVLKSGPSTTT